MGLVLPLKRLSLALATGLLLMALASGYWGMSRSAALLARPDNPRRALLERRVPRGPIYDRHGTLLAETVGPAGEYERHYPYASLAPVLGYVSPLYGRAGIEAALDGTLHGDEGLDPADVYWRSSVLGLPPPGRAVRLTIDLPVQAAADLALGEQAGAVVVLQAATGEILALSSHPSYDANTLETDWDRLVADPGAPLLNRATLGLYQPGAALWPLVVAAAAQADPAAVDRVMPSATAPVPINGQSVGCRQTPGATALSLGEALRFGCPAPFAALGAALGAEGLQASLASFGLLEAPALEIATTAAEGPAIGDAALAAIGQDALTVTPLHLALAMAAIQRDGVMPAPLLVLAAELPGGIWRPAVPAGAERQALTPEAAALVKSLLPDGYAGTALTGTGGETVAWYTGFAPAENPCCVVVVVVESGDADAAAQVGRAVAGGL
jgi:peptidoglycan glycosyltransferase